VALKPLLSKPPAAPSLNSRRPFKRPLTAHAQHEVPTNWEKPSGTSPSTPKFEIGAIDDELERRAGDSGRSWVLRLGSMNDAAETRADQIANQVTQAPKVPSSAEAKTPRAHGEYLDESFIRSIA